MNRHPATGAEAADDAWVEQVLRAARPLRLADAGFGAAVLARIAATRPRLLAPSAALASLKRAETRERTHLRWTLGGALAGALVAVLAGIPGPLHPGDPGAILLPGLASLVVSGVMAWLAISRS